MSCYLPSLLQMLQWPWIRHLWLWCSHRFSVLNHGAHWFLLVVLAHVWVCVVGAFSCACDIYESDEGLLCSHRSLWIILPGNGACTLFSCNVCHALHFLFLSCFTCLEVTFIVVRTIKVNSQCLWGVKGLNWWLCVSLQGIWSLSSKPLFLQAPVMPLSVLTCWLCFTVGVLISWSTRLRGYIMMVAVSVLWSLAVPRGAMLGIHLVS